MVPLMTYKIAKDLAPSYISDLIKPYIPPQVLCTQRMGLLPVPRVEKKSACCKGFIYCAPFHWLNPPADIGQSYPNKNFKYKLKNHVFCLTLNL